MNDLLARLHAQLQTAPRAGVSALLPPAKPSTHRIEAATDTTVVWVYDAIGQGGVDAAELVPALAAVKGDAIEVRLNSPGGDYFDGVAIANALARHPAQVTVHVDGLAASAASVIAMAGDHVVMHPGAQMMIHDALTMTIGNAEVHDKTRTLLDSASQDIAALYASRAGGDQETWRTAMLAETWYTATEAVTAGLAHEAPVPDAPVEGPRWAAVLTAFHTVSRETQTPSTEPQSVEVASSDTHSPVSVNLSEQLCSAFREATK